MAILREELAKFGVCIKDKLRCDFKKSLYGLKQAGRFWRELLHEKLVGAEFARCLSDMCLYYKHCGKETIIVGVYVDDLLVTASKKVLAQYFFSDMCMLSIKDLGKVSKFLGMRVVHKDGVFFLYQQAAIE